MSPEKGQSILLLLAIVLFLILILIAFYLIPADLLTPYLGARVR